MSPNVQEAERPRKRSHDEYAAEDGAAKENGTNGAHNPAYPSNPTSTAQQQPPKRKRLTAAEKAAKADEEAKKKQEREDARLQKLAEKARAEKEKQAAKEAKQQERDEKRKKKEEEERRVREEKEAKERRAREEKEKKERSQLRLQAFFTKPTTPKKDAASAGTGAAGIGAAAGADAAGGRGGAEASPIAVRPAKKDAKAERTEYERMFQPFFVKEHVRMARSRPLLDSEAEEAKARILDEYVSGARGYDDALVRPFRPLEALQLPAKPRRAGKAHPPVRAVMEELQRGSSAAALETLRGIPMKLIYFRQDVRPPYFGTLTCAPHELGQPRLRRAGRRPCERVLELQYDYDSEAEWQDDEPGDDLDDVDDEEEDLDEDDDMEEFLDDSEDAGVARRIFANGMEPESTGVCFEGGEGGSVREGMRGYRMEVILGSLDQKASIDPFATHYWSPPKKAAKMPPPPPPKNAQPKNAFAALKAGDATTTAAPTPAVQIPKPELLPDFRKAVLANQKLSKGAIVEVLGLQFDGLSKAETRAMLEYVAEKGAGKGKVWELKEVKEVV
ncbi:uncharacterized protein DNG_09545 [Cephalotrichum gorgonifer]|uniref:Uncharacterized protein n=1 Tax=Cephalotrichum gorgonifer TaxID=2041049 RepID=A0AAE8N5W7_9PEZI|nr:uncharacterized protein DNG_09545 [Cephalotrichum gorgonifer]